VTQLTNRVLNAKRVEQWDRYLVPQNVFLVINLFIPYFWELTYTGQTGWQIFALDGSNDADSHKDVHFRVSFILLSI